ncbi:MAG: hypothetical protein ACYC0V_00170 [Armatimonadota bacterium]
MATSSFDKRIIITDKKAVETILKHLRTPSSTPNAQDTELKMATREGLARKIQQR